MAPVHPLQPEALRRVCDPKSLPFETTDELKDLEVTLGQDRAVEAIEFGIGIRRDGFNLFALGPTGIGKHEVVTEYLEQKAAGEKTPDDWCYVNNFKEPHMPRALRLPAGEGQAFRKEMARLVEGLRTAIPAAFQSEDYQTRKQAIEGRYKELHQQAFQVIEAKGKEKDIALLRTPMGLGLAPVRRGEVLGPAEFERLSEREKERIQKDIEALQEELRSTLRQVLQWEQEERSEIKNLNREVTEFAVRHLWEEAHRKYQKYPDILEYLEAAQQDVIENAPAFLRPEGPANGMGLLPGLSLEPVARKYEVNVLVDHGETRGAPIVYEDHPTMQNLVGRVEHRSQFGTLMTDFTLIKPGALHRANGGYLILDVRRLLQAAFSWEALKGALRRHRIRIESPAQQLDLLSTVTLEPEPIPLDVKVILLGERVLYYLLDAYDPDFQELFKVAADFDDRMGCEGENAALYARLIATLARNEKLRALDTGAVAEVMEHGSRLAGDQEKLSTHRENLLDVLREADYWAETAKSDVVRAEHVQRAIEKQIRRSDRVRERIHEAIERGTVLIDTAGARTGQVNGLSVLQIGGFAFGTPSRITARVRLGKGEVVDIEREVKLGGPIHSKGVLILNGFLGARYALEHPLSLSASLVFEQNYGGVEGDSASLAETCALLSALANVPLHQNLAVTGSVNQHGQVQAVGGVNEKIEGFFDVCKARGLSGDQGVLLPQSNVKHLMLRRDVVEAVRARKFSVYAVQSVDEALEILTGQVPGERGADGKFAEGTVNAKVEARLIELAELARKRAARPAAPEKKPDEANNAPKPNDDNPVGGRK